MTTMLRAALSVAALCSVSFAAASRAMAVGVVFNVPPAAAPTTLLAGQTMNLGVGGSVDIGFSSAAGSTINVQGGSLQFATIGGRVEVFSGALGGVITALSTSDVTVHSGNSFAIVNTAGDFTVQGGLLQGEVSVGNGGRVNVKGGELSIVMASENSDVLFEGGKIGGTLLPMRGTFTMSGGDWGGRFWLGPGSTFNLSGGVIQGPLTLTETVFNVVCQSVLVGGSPIAGLIPGTPHVVTQRDTTLSGVLLDGSPFSFDMNTGIMPDDDSFPVGATVRVTVIPEPASISLAVAFAVIVAGMRFRATR
jgi:hypothetical protein